MRKKNAGGLLSHQHFINSHLKWISRQSHWVYYYNNYYINHFLAYFLTRTEMKGLKRKYRRIPKVTPPRK